MKYKLSTLLDGLTMLNVLLIAVFAEWLAELPFPQLVALTGLLLAPTWLKETLQHLPSPRSNSPTRALSGSQWRRRWAV